MGSECQADWLTALDWGVGHDEMPIPDFPMLEANEIALNLYRYAFDLDGTLCDTDGMSYSSAKPRPAMIALVNALYDAGHHVEIRTGRGYLSGDVAGQIERADRQLRSWGCRFTKIGPKSPADVYFDDGGVRVRR